MPRWPSRTAALLLVASISWTVNQTTDPWHGLSREDLHLTGNVREILVEEADIFSSASGSREGARSRVEWIEFDKDGRVTEWIEFDRSGDPESTRRYSYADGLLILEEEYRRTRWPHETIAYTHETDGGRTTAEVRAGDGTLRKTIVCERDEEGRPVRGRNRPGDLHVRRRRETGRSVRCGRPAGLVERRVVRCRRPFGGALAVHERIRGRPVHHLVRARQPRPRHAGGDIRPSGHALRDRHVHVVRDEDLVRIHR